MLIITSACLKKTDVEAEAEVLCSYWILLKCKTWNQHGFVDLQMQFQTSTWLYCLQFVFSSCKTVTNVTNPILENLIGYQTQRKGDLTLYLWCLWWCEYDNLAPIRWQHRYIKGEMIVFHFVPTNHSVLSQAAAHTLSCPIWSTTLCYYGAICNCHSFYLGSHILNIFCKYASQLFNSNSLTNFMR